MLKSELRLSGIERGLLVLPLLAGFAFGLFPLLAAQQSARLANYLPNDPLIYWLAGAATLGYGVALLLALRAGTWASVRLVLMALLTFNALAFLAGIIEIAQGRANGRPVVFLIEAASLIFVVIGGSLLYAHRGQQRSAQDTAPWVRNFLIFGVVAALGTGLLGYLGPGLFKPVFGMEATNPFVYRILGAATIGYGVMGIAQIASGRWEELRLPFVMSGLFNMFAVILGIIALAQELPPLLPMTLPQDSVGEIIEWQKGHPEHIRFRKNRYAISRRPTMSLKPLPIEPIPEETVRVAQAAFPHGHRYLTLRAPLGTAFSAADFADLFPVRGQPALAPWRLALVTIFHYLEPLSERQAGEAVWTRIDGQYALGLPLTDPGFDFSVLSEFRSRLIAGQALDRWLERLVEPLHRLGWLQAGGPDSTHILAHVRRLSRVDLVGDPLRAALHIVAMDASPPPSRLVGPLPFDATRRAAGEAAVLALTKR